MNRYLLIDRETNILYDCNYVELSDIFDRFGSSVACINNFDLYNECLNLLIDEIILNNNLYNGDKQEILYQLQKRLIKDIEKVKENERKGEL